MAQPFLAVCLCNGDRFIVSLDHDARNPAPDDTFVQVDVPGRQHAAAFDLSKLR